MVTYPENTQRPATVSMGAWVTYALSQAVHNRYVLCDTMSDLCHQETIFRRSVGIGTGKKVPPQRGI